jgi:hypothetical protein
MLGLLSRPLHLACLSRLQFPAKIVRPGTKEMKRESELETFAQHFFFHLVRMDHRGHQGQAPQHQHHNQHNGRHSSAQDVVTSHYNARPNTRVEDRVKSPIYYLRNFNNWIKSVIIADYTPSRAVVLDLCAGKGGDLPKWCKARIQYWVAAGNLFLFLFSYFNLF